jgi:6-phosphogluconolactonase (cycloisomerase 2 family)
VSVTVHHGVGYVLNHDSDSIAGFSYDKSGDLTPLPGTTRGLTANPAGGLTDAAQVQLSPNGRTLVVTERAANAIDTFTVRAGHAGEATSHPSAGTVPYGFDFDRRGTLVVSEAASGSASSYDVAPRFRNLTEALGDTQAAACWLVVSGDYAWVVNAASASISSYRIAKDGSIELVDAVAASTGAGPTDAAVSPDGGSLHVRMRDGSLSSFTIGSDGSLASAGSAFASAAFGVAGLVAD